MALVANIIGVTGAFLILLAYFLLAIGKMSSEEKRYHLLNLFGALGILFSLFWYWNLATLIMETAWISVSLYGLWKIRRSTSG